MRVLGYLFNSTNDTNSQINELVQSLNYRLVSLAQISKYCKQKSIAQFIQAYVIGKLNYMVSAYLSSPAYQLSKIDKVIVRAAWMSVGAFKARRMSNKQVIAECGFRTIQAYMQISGLNFFHKMVRNKKPEILYNKLKIPSRQCKNSIFIIQN